MKVSAGILLYRMSAGEPEFFLVHPGGPFFAKKDAGWWTVPKGLVEDGEEPLQAALREFEEETGYSAKGEFTVLKPIMQKGGKKVLCWAVQDIDGVDANAITCNTFEMMWPPKSGKMQQFPEVDKAGWFNYNKACKLINGRQIAFLDEMLELLNKKTPL